MTLNLREPSVDGGTRFVNFFEGRILTGRDLRDEQAADRRQRTDLGRGIGAGIVHGLEVSDATSADTPLDPVVRVSAGLAINAEGQTLALPSDKLVCLTRTDNAPADATDDDFGPCSVHLPGSSLTAGIGFYILTIGPATEYEQQAPQSGLDDTGVAGGCGRRYETLGVQFRLVQFNPVLLAPEDAQILSALVGRTDPTGLSQLRNRVAHLCFGTADAAAFPLDPFSDDPSGESSYQNIGILDALRAGSTPPLQDCETPLGVIYWTQLGIGYLDMWSVRRRVVQTHTEAEWPLVAADRQRAVGEAMFFQFQRHLAWLRGLLGSTNINAAGFFRYLPPAGLLDFGNGVDFLGTRADPDTLTLPAARLNAVLDAARAYPAVDLASESARFCLFSIASRDTHALFVLDTVPSAEKTDRKCAELEARIEMLEELISTPGTISGSVRLRRATPPNFTTAALTINSEDPIPGIPVIVQGGSDGSVAGAVTDIDGNFTVSVQPGTYTVTLQLPLDVMESFGIGPVENVSIVNGSSQVVDFILVQAQG
ncbi:MAG: carboxypeptidase-like regulatory domain-containing protein [Pseudomonadota bacterium]